MERRGFLGTVGATITALLIPWKNVPSFSQKGTTGVDVLEDPRFGSVHVPAEPVPRQVRFKYEGHLTKKGPTVPAGQAMDIPFAQQSQLEGIEILYPNGGYGEHYEVKVFHGSS